MSTISAINSQTPGRMAQPLKNRLGAVIRFPGVYLVKLTSLNNWANPGSRAKIKSDFLYRDISSSSDHEPTDYSKPVWRR